MRCYGGLKSQDAKKNWFFLRFFWKTTPYGKIFKILFWKFLSRHRSTCRVQISQNLTDGQSVKLCVIYPTKKFCLFDHTKIFHSLQFFPAVAWNSLRIPWVFQVQRIPSVFQVSRFFQACCHPVKEKSHLTILTGMSKHLNGGVNITKSCYLIHLAHIKSYKNTLANSLSKM